MLFGFFKSKLSSVSCLDNSCEHPTRPRGAHCNFRGVFLSQYNPKLLATDIYNVKDLSLSNPSGVNLHKLSTIFPEDWSPTECTLKVMKAISSERKKIIPMSRLEILKIVAYTEENIEIVVFYDMKTKKLALFYPNFQEELV